VIHHGKSKKEREEKKERKKRQEKEEKEVAKFDVQCSMFDVH
jgi:hypothetical protein